MTWHELYPMMLRVSNRFKMVGEDRNLFLSNLWLCEGHKWLEYTDPRYAYQRMQYVARQARGNEYRKRKTSPVVYDTGLAWAQARSALDKSYEQIDRQDSITHGLKQLTSQEHEVIHSLFYKGRTLDATRKILGFKSKSVIYDIRERALKKMRKELEDVR